MIKYKLILWFLLLISGFTFGQKIKEFDKNDHNTYIKLEFYKRFYNKPLTSKDLAALRVFKGDSLVLIQKGKELRQKPSNKLERSKSYLPLNQFKKMFMKNFTKSDSLNFLIRNNDTLVLMPIIFSFKNKVAVPYESKDSVFLEIYKDVVFQKYSDSTRSKDLKMRYWKDDIRIFFNDNVNTNVKKELTKFATYLSEEVDSLHISFVDKLEKSNYLIYGLDSDQDYKYEPRLESKKVDFYAFWNNKNQIYNVKLQIDTRSYDNEEDLILKSKKLFLASLGFFYYTYMLPKECYLSLRYSMKKKFTEKDLEILKYHYSYGICKGTDLKYFEAQHKNAQNLLKKGTRIEFVHSY